MFTNKTIVPAQPENILKFHFALTVRSLIGEVAIHCMVRDSGPCVLLFWQPFRLIFKLKNKL